MKKLVLVLLAVVFIAGIYAFTNVNAGNVKVAKVNYFDPIEWHFTGSNPTNPNDYASGGGTDCGLPVTVCTLVAPADANGKPDMNAIVPGTSSQTVQQRINAALSAPGGPSTNETVTALKDE